MINGQRRLPSRHDPYKLTGDSPKSARLERTGTATRPETNRNFHLSLCISFSLLDTVNPYHTTWSIGQIYVRAARALYMFIYIPESFPFRIYRFPPYLIRPWGEEAVALCLCRIIISSY